MTTSFPDLVVGALVVWPSAPGAPLGVVVEVDGPRVRVRFDGDPELKSSMRGQTQSSESDSQEWSDASAQAP